jgi:hypothetical protein
MIRARFIDQNEPFADARQDYRRPMRGECREIFNGTPFLGTKVHGNPRFRIVDIELDEMTPALWLLEREPYEPGVLRHQRRWTVNMDALEAAAIARWQRQFSAGDIIQIDHATLQSLATVKRLVADPRILG